MKRTRYEAPQFLDIEARVGDSSEEEDEDEDGGYGASTY
jgi:hypothetical protein